MVWLGAATSPTQRTPQQKEFGAVFLHKGLPPNLPAPILRSIKKQLDKTEYAIIPTGSASSYVAFLRGEPMGTGRAFPPQWIWFQDPSGVGTFSSASFKQQEDGLLSVDLKVPVGAGNTSAVPLELRLLPQQHLLLFRWGGTGQGMIGGAPTVDQYHQESRLGEPVPDFTAERVDGNLVSLREFRGHILVLNTWATSCTGCVEEMPGLNKLVEKFSKRGVVFLALANNTKEQVRIFLSSRPYKYRQALLGERGMELFGNAFPRNLIVDPHGKVVYDFTGGSSKTASRLEPVIEKLLAKKE